MKNLSKRPLGNSEIEVSSLGLGTVKFGRNQDVKYPKGFALPEDREVEALLAQASELGINLLDTAPAYGSSEQRLGRLLKNRDDWVIMTKVGEEFVSGQSYFNFSAEHVRKSVQRSLRHMSTDYLDIVLIHSDGNDLDILQKTDCLATLQDLKQEGLIRAVGMSSKTVAGGLKAVELSDVVMVTYNREQTQESEVIDAAAQQGKGVLIKKALNSGHLVVDGEQGAAADLNFCLSRPGVSSVIVGTINPQHLASNVAAAIAAEEN